MKRLLQLILVLLITTGLTTIANAQAQITASANVQATVSITGDQGLNFKEVVLGTDKTVPYDDNTNAGAFTVSGNGKVSLSFTLPSNLTNGNSTPMPITFGKSNAAWTDNGTTNNVFDPNSGTPVNLSGADSSDGIISVFIGGTVQPAANQEPGTYTNTITLTATHM